MSRLPLRALALVQALASLALLLLSACAPSQSASEAPASPASYPSHAQAAPAAAAAPPPAPMPSAPPGAQPSMAPSFVEEAVDDAPESAAESAATPPGAAPGKAASAPAPAKSGSPAPRAPGAKQAPPEGASKDATQERPRAPMLIYTGQLGMETDDQEAIPTTLDKVIDLAESFGGYLAARTDTNVQVRVPSARFREALTALEKLGKVIRRSVTAEDVSEQYHDLEVRLSNLKAVQKRLQEFLARTQNINEALTVERELERIGREIDQTEGRMRFLRSRASFSLITVDVAFRPKTTATVVGGGPPPPPPPRNVDLPIPWIPKVGLTSLLNLRPTDD